MNSENIENIFHILSKDDWLNALDAGEYRPESLSKEGFIHFSTRHQLEGTANRFFLGKNDLMVIVVELESVVEKIKFEKSVGDAEVFPHLYGPLKVDYVKSIVDFRKHNDGSFTLPPELANLEC